MADNFYLLVISIITIILSYCDLRNIRLLIFVYIFYILNISYIRLLDDNILNYYKNFKI